MNQYGQLGALQNAQKKRKGRGADVGGFGRRKKKRGSVRRGCEGESYLENRVDQYGQPGIKHGKEPS